jgi:hypothetical protein
MGQLCSSPAKEDKEAPDINPAPPTAERLPEVIDHGPSKKDSKAAAIPALNLAANGSEQKLITSSSAADSAIDAALDLARKELKRSKGKDFESTYTLGKLVGHGAFAKVSVCEHNQTKARFAAKVVIKNLEDPKQVEGRFKCMIVMLCDLSIP